MDSHQIFLDELSKFATNGAAPAPSPTVLSPAQQIVGEGESVLHGIGEKLRAGGGALRAGISKYPGITGLGLLGLGAYALHQKKKRQQAEQRLGMA